MNRPIRAVVAAAVVASLSCSHAAAPKAAPSPSGSGTAAAPARPAPPTPPAAPPAATPPAAGQGIAGGPPGGPPGGGRGGRVPLTPEQRAARRDSINAADAVIVQKLLAQIAGKENASSQDVWQNLELMQDTTAAQLVKVMDSYSRAMGRGCDFCHVADKWADDSKANKKRARTMIQITNAINREQLTKMPADREGTPKITCMTCHRGANSPNGAIVP